MSAAPFNNRTVVITGASSGIGAALARRFAPEGARMALVARRRDRLQTLANELESAGHHRPVVLAADLFNDEAHAYVLDRARDALGHIDVLVNNAGLGFAGRFEAHAAGQIEQMIQLNVRALVRMTHLILPEMLKRRNGWIMNVASTASYQPMPYMATYAASKAFVLSFSEALWGEYRKRGVVVTAVNPGTTKTEFFDDHGWSRAREVFISRAMTAESVADIAVRALARGKPSVICGWSNRLLAAVSRLTPRRWTARLIAKALKPPPEDRPRAD
jgi:short-subunit dehydrogenase